MAANKYTGGSGYSGPNGNPMVDGAADSATTNGAPYASSPRTTGGAAHPNLKQMPLTSAVMPPEQHMDREDGAHSRHSSGEYIMDENPFATPTPKNPSRVRRAAESTIWGRSWETPLHITLQPPPGDYRDQLPPSMEQVAEAYKDVVRNGDWTFGLLEMWGRRSKIPKGAVHIPCWEAYRLSPTLWRGACFGRTCHQCFWLGVDRSRWARQVYGAGLGREYKVPCLAVPESHYKGRIAAVCAFQCFIGEAAGIGMAFVGPGFCCLNFAACYTCHSREKIRRKYNLPATWGLPPGFDDCCTHFVCMYCATHQEARELAVRGVDGPGMHVLDMCPEGFSHLPGYKEAVEERAKVREVLMQRPPGEFLTMGRRIWNEPGRIGGVARPHRAAQSAAAKLASSYQAPELEAPTRDEPPALNGAGTKPPYV